MYKTFNYFNEVWRLVGFFAFTAFRNIQMEAERGKEKLKLWWGREREDGVNKDREGGRQTPPKLLYQGRVCLASYH